MGHFQRVFFNGVILMSFVSLCFYFTLYHAVYQSNKVIIQNAQYVQMFSNVNPPLDFQNDTKIVAINIRHTMKNLGQESSNLKPIENFHGNSTKVIGSDSNVSKGYQSNNMGFVVATIYAEQQVGAAMNLFSLQKWAKFVGASVVEPYVRNSMFGLPITTSKQVLNSSLRFSDYFNVDVWNEISTKKNGTPLVSWETFVKKNPKKIISLAFLSEFKNASKRVYIDNDTIDEPDCISAHSWFKKKHIYYTDKLLKAVIVRQVCLSFYSKRMNISDFTKHIYGNFDPSNVVVWIHIWKGFAYNNRVRIVQHFYHRHPETMTMLHTSKRIIADSQKYVRKYLESDFGEYTGISFRSIKRAKYIDLDKQPDFFQNCIKQLGYNVSSLSSANKKIFMSIDLGRFGDKTARRFLLPGLYEKIEKDLFSAVYNESVTMQKWERTFVESTGITDSGYIATLQRTILENSRCLIMFGGDSNFQRTLLLEYKNKNDENVCLYDVCYIE